MPMLWTQVVLVESDAIANIEVRDVEGDLVTDKTMQQIRKSASRETRSLLFDPEEFKDRR